MRKLSSILIALVACITFANAETINGTCGENLTWSLNSKDSTITIEGSGVMTSMYPNTSYPWYNYISYIAHICLPDDLENIGQYAFYYCTKLTSLVVPNSVTIIEDGAFANCSSLTSVTIGRNVETIANGAFQYCNGLTSITIGNSITSIGNAFYGCNNLTSVTCEATTPPTIGSETFSNYNATLFVPEESIEAYKKAFFWEGFTNILPINDCITSGKCGDNLTWELSCDSVLTISGTGEMWEYYDIYDYSSGEYSDTIPWDKQGVRTLVVQRDVKGISNYAFNKSTNLRTIYWNVQEYGREYMDDIQKFPYLERIIFGEEVETIPGLICYRCENLKEVNISSSVKTIGGSAFAECAGLTSISLPESITHIGQAAFSSCTSLTSLTIPSGVTKIEHSAFSGCYSLSSIEIPNSVIEIEDEAFYACVNLTSISWNMKNCQNTYLSSEKPLELSLGEDVESFGGYCTGLVSITSRAINPPSLDEYVFQDVDKSIPVYVSGGSISDYQKANVWKDFKNIRPICETIETEETRYLCSGTSFMWYGMSYSGGGDYTTTLTTIHGCDSIVTLHLIELPELTGDTTATVIKGSSFNWHGVEYTAANTPATHTYASKVYPYCDSIVTLHLVEIDPPCQPVSGTCGDNLIWELSCDSVLTISGTGEMRHGSFWYYSPFKDVRHIILKEGVTDLCGAAFSEFWMLKSVEIPESLTMLKDSVFFLCSSLESIEIPSGMTSMGYQVFSGCSSLTSITCKAVTPPTLGFGVFDGVDKSIPLYVPGPSINLYKSADQWKDFFNILPIPGTEVPVYPVIFLDYNSDVLSEQSVAHNSAAVAPQVPAREGYTFSGWSTDIEHIVARTFAIAIYDKIGGTLTYLSEEGDMIATENVDLHLPAAPIIAGKSFKGWLTESADTENGIVLRATYTFDNPTTHDDVTITPSSNSAYVIFPFITGALTYQLVIRDLFGNVVCKIMFSATGHLLGIAFAPSRNRESQQATQTTGFNFTVEGLDANTTYEYEFVANDDTDEVIETLSGSFTTTAEVPTDNEQVNSPSAVRKYLEDGHLMINANAHIFDSQGKMVR